MNIRKGAVMFSFMLIITKVVGEAGLSYSFYEQSCPRVEDVVRAGFESISAADPTTPSAILRLMFHDCQVQGCDASVLLDPEDDSLQSEMSSSKSFGIRKRESISIIKSMVESACPSQVSCADILILAAREAVAMSGGPRIKVPLGRRDSSIPPSVRLADAWLPPANIDVDEMLHMFSTKGMNIEESVAIMGAHTIGVTHCGNIRSGPQSIEIEPGLEMQMKLSCPFGSLSSNTSFLVNDPTALFFDNQYYINALNGLGLLGIDAEMPIDPRTAPYVQQFAANQNHFFQAFSSAFVKLSSSSFLSARQGMVRRTCNALN